MKKRLNEIICRKRTIKLILTILSKIVNLFHSHSKTKFDSKRLKVLHISPIFFDVNKSLQGGGERAPFELAKTMASYCETKYISFGEKSQTLSYDKLPIKIYPYIGLFNNEKNNPINFRFLSEIKWADVVHCHPYYSITTAFTILVARLFGKKIFVTDYGGWVINYNKELQLDRLVDKFLVISEFGKQFFNEFKTKKEVIYLGIDEKKFYSLPNKKQDYVLYVGRILPHKGISYLVEAVNSLNVELHIVGSALHKGYLNYLKNIADKERVKFITDVPDEVLLKEYNNAIVTVLPSVYKDIYGNEHKGPELLGLVLLESMFCETPVICTKVGAMPEIVGEGKTGFVVPACDSSSLAEKIDYLLKHKEIAKQMGAEGRKFVLENFTMDKVALRCITEYRN
ncbi:MAG: glycosyltransferase family 4 protein [bacterium]|nr:glycosyltransferase family 4 protein [bacterium]